MKRNSDRTKRLKTLFRSGIGFRIRERATAWRKIFDKAGFREERGTAIIEMAFALPILMIALTGTASFSLALYRMQQLGNAATTAAQQLGAQAGTLSDPCATTVTTVTGVLPGWTASKLSYKVTITDATGTANAYSSPTTGSFTCTAGSTEMAPNEPVTVQVTYNYTWLPIVSFSPSGNLSATESALME